MADLGQLPLRGEDQLSPLIDAPHWGMVIPASQLHPVAHLPPEG